MYHLPLSERQSSTGIWFRWSRGVGGSTSYHNIWLSKTHIVHPGGLAVDSFISAPLNRHTSSSKLAAKVCLIASLWKQQQPPASTECQICPSDSQMAAALVAYIHPWDHTFITFRYT